MYKILIVEDHPLFRSPIKQLLTKTLGKVVVKASQSAQGTGHGGQDHTDQLYHTRIDR
ncbi:MAG: hypothetical protein ACREJU_02055 [Nitrospiraceae bacterium]